MSRAGYAYPVFLPDGESPLMAVKVVTLVLSGIPHIGIRNIAYSPSGHLLYDNPKGLWGIAFSLSNLAVAGKPFLIDPAGFGPSVSNDGTMVYTINSYDRLVLVDRKGVVIQPIIGELQRDIQYPTMSPDMRKVAVAAEGDGNRDIWIHDAVNGTKERLTRTPGREQPDGKHFVVIQPVDGIGSRIIVVQNWFEEFRASTR